MSLTIPIIIFLVTIAGIILIFMQRIARIKNENENLFFSEQSKNKEALSNSENEISLLKERLSVTQNQKEELINEINQFKKTQAELTSENIKQNTENAFLKEKIQEQAKEFERLQKQATSEFENIANKILKKNTEDFSEVNQQKIHDLILPLKEKIQTFEKKVEDTYEKGLKDQTDLRAELKKLYDLNNRISDEANNLTKALKGDVKKQGNWGEIVLERILERSGLTEGQEFEREKVMQNAEGKTIRPDVIVNLPDKKNIIIDSKVSLVAYERFVNTDNPIERERHIKDHLISLKAHVKELNVKHYSSSPSLNSPDFVLLFIPIEASFSIAIEEDQQLFNYAWDNKVVIVSPSTLLATLRTIASIWQQENQTKHAFEIAKQSGMLYDKFVGFIEDIDKLGNNISTLQKTYDNASKKLYTGTGNLVRRVEKLKELGASAQKEIPDKFRE